MTKIEDVLDRALFGVLLLGPTLLSTLRSSSIWLAFVGAACVLALGFPPWKAIALGCVFLVVRTCNAYWKSVDFAVIALVVVAIAYHSDIDFKQVASFIRSAAAHD